jgi:tetratricopeptide (TPR) repeat protein
MGRNFDTHRSRGGGGSQFSQTLSLGVVAALAAAAVYYAKLQYERSLRDDEERRAEEKNRKLGKLPPKTPRGGAAGKEQTPQASNVSVASSKKSEARAKARSDSPNKRSPEELSLHAKIEEIDKRGKALFKAKQYLEAAVAFTEALDLIEQAGDSTLSNSLIRQVVTLTNNRSAMYEKGQMPDLALVDCDAILELELGHVKARTRRLRILESQQKWHEALMEVCALQLKFMQDNRDKLRQGIPVGNPPVAQSKIEQLMTSVLPGEIEAVEAQQKERDNANNKGGQRPLPSNYTILQLLKSFGGYNQWMGQAARDGSVESFSKQLDESSTPNAERAVLLWKRGRRHAYDGKFDVAKDDFDAASDLLEDDTIKAELQDGTSGDNYARILEWAGMAKHLTYNLDGALKYYEECSDIEPTNVRTNTQTLTCPFFVSFDSRSFTHETIRLMPCSMQ